MSVRPHEYEHVPPEEVLQHDEEGPPVRIHPIPVEVEGFVLSKDIGAQEWSGTYYSVGATNPVQIAQPQPARSLMYIEVGTGTVWLGRTEAEARAKSGLKVGGIASKLYPMRHREEVWALSDSGNVDVSVYQEYSTT